MELKSILKALNEKKITPEEARREIRKINSSSDDSNINLISGNLDVYESKVDDCFCNDMHIEDNEYKIISEQGEAVAIIGISGRYPNAENMDRFWDVLVNGKNTIREIPTSRWNVDDYYDDEISKEENIYCKWIGMIDNVDCFDSLFFEIPPAEAEVMDPQHRIFLEEGYKAFEDAGYSRRALNNKKCGVYLGIVNGEYDSLSQQSTNDRVSITGNSNAIGAARIAYYLNLKGPAISIDTACSSSLVGSHLAVQALARGEIEMALVGGVSLYLVPQAYMCMCMSGMLSADGKCKTFDNDANGFVPGEGVGAVVLKRLKDAQADHDHIYGIIVGSGINQDGKTNGITAPNLGSQIELVHDMYNRYNIDPASISYAELHGTGTKLGDPIELEALATAFSEKTNKKNYCAIGSVKSNIGHTSAAAGMAGLHKILLCMKHNKLVPTLNIRKPNEHFDFNNSPFYINTESKSWKGIEGYPRRACISSFGFSGTNAHAVIEEYFESDIAEKHMIIDSHHPGIFILSARNEAQLNVYIQNIKDYIDENDEIDIVNLLYTMQVGREPMEERIAVITSNIKDLSRKLLLYLQNRNDVEDIFRGKVNKKEMRIKDTANRLKIEVDGNNIAGHKTKENNLDKRKLYELVQRWINGEIVEWEKLYVGYEPRRISLPTYPFENKKHLLHKNEKSTLKELDGKKDVVLIHPLLHQNVSDFSEQCFKSIFTGDEFFLTDHKVNGKKILPGVAILEMARAAGEMAGRKKVQSISNIVWLYPIEVNGNGQTVNIRLYPDRNKAAFEVTITDELNRGSEDEILCAEGKIEYDDSINQQNSHSLLNITAYRSSCQASINTKKNYEEMKMSGLNYGPTFQTIDKVNFNESEVLASLKLKVNNDKTDIREFILYPGLLDGALQTISSLIQNSEESVYLPFSMGRIRIYSKLLETGYVYTTRSKNQSTTSIKSFDIVVSDDEGNVLVEIEEFTVKPVQVKENLAKNDKLVSDKKNIEDSISTLYYKSVWELEENKQKSKLKTEYTGFVLIFDINDKLRNELQIQAGNKKYNSIILVKPGKNYEVLDNNTYVVNPTKLEDYRKLLDGLKIQGFIPNKVIHYWSNDDSISEQKQIDERLERGVYSVFAFSQALIELKIQSRVKLLYLYKGEKLDIVPENGAMSGFFKTIHLENPLFEYKNVELMNSNMSVARISEVLLEEFYKEGHEIEIRRDGQQRWIRKIREIESEKKTFTDSLLRDNGVYLITGGLGGLGIRFARYLSEKVKARIVLVGRREPNEKDLENLKDIEAIGSEVLYVRADVSKRQDVEKLIIKAKARFNRIDGVIHSAGVNRDSLIWKKKPEKIAEVLAAKVYGTRYLDEMLKNESLDFFVMFSSLASILGNVGQCDYSYANSYMDHFATIREDLRADGQRHGKTLAINWPFWSEGGMDIDCESRIWMENKAGIIPLNVEEGIKVFENGLCYSVPQIILLKGNVNKIHQLLNDSLHIQANNKINEQNCEQEFYNFLPEEKTEMKGMTKEQLREKTEQYLKEVLFSKTKISVDEIDVFELFDKYGIDSILVMSLTRALEESFGELSKTLFFEYRNLSELANYFIDNKSETLVKMFTKTLEFGRKENVIKTTRKRHSVKESINGNRLHLLKDDRIVKRENDLIIDDIAIIGISGRYPMADNLEQFWENLKAGKDCITEIPKERWDYHRYYDANKQSIGTTYSKWGGFINDVEMFDPLFFNIPPIEAELMDPQTRLFLEISWQALEDAGYTRASLEKDKVGVFVGVMDSMYALYQGEVKGKKVPIVSSYASVANHISYFCDFKGPSVAIDTMCSSALTALHLGCGSIRNGESDLVIAGGVNLTLHPNKYILLSMGKFASSDGRCRSFGEGGDGYVPGEGVGAVLLKPLRKAIDDKDHIYGVIKGSSINSGGKTSGFTVPNPNAQGKLIKNVIDKVDIDARTISYIETHGTGTSLGDPIEIAGLTKGLGDQTSEGQYCSIGSIKSNIGHLEAASGIAGLTKVLLQMQNHQLVPSIHSEALNPYINFKSTKFYVQQELKYWEEPIIEKDGKKSCYPRRAGISSFGAGGANAHVIVEEYKPIVEESSTKCAGPKLYVLSARNEDRLKKYAGLILDYFKRKITSTLAGQSLQRQQNDGVQLINEKVSIEQIRKKIISITAQILGIKEADIDPKNDIDEYGFDIVQSMHFQKCINQEMEIDIPNSEFNTLRSINEISKYINGIVGAEKLENERIEKLSILENSSVAYTLQVGREAMEERLAIIAESMEELVEKLTLYLYGKDRVEQLFTGNILDNKQKLKSIIEEKTRSKDISSLVYSRELEKVAELWVAGADIDWKLLYDEQIPYRISLPTYPFAKERYWAADIENSENIKTFSEEGVHPLLHRNTSNIYELRFSTTFTGHEFFLEDHVVKEKMILPGVVYLEMACEAVKCAMEVTDGDNISIRIKNVVWLKPFEVENKPVNLHISLLPNELGEIGFTIYSDVIDEATEALIHCQGSVQVEQAVSSSPINIESIKSQCSISKLDGEWYYKIFKAIGINYGPSHQGIETVYKGQNQMMVALTLPSSIEKNFTQFIIHPSLLDSALQATITLSLPLESSIDSTFNGIMDNRKIELPFALNEIEIIRRCKSKMWAFIRPDLESKPVDKMQKINIDICDLQGNICVRLKQISFRIFENEAEKLDMISTDAVEQMMFTKQWKEKNISLGESTVEFSKRLVILCELNNIFMEEIETRLPYARCIALKSEAESIAERYQDYTVQLLKETQDILSNRPKEKILIQLFIQTDYEKQILAGLSGFLKTVQLENSNLICQLIEAEQEYSIDEICTVLKENGRCSSANHIRYKDNRRFVCELSELTRCSENKSEHMWKDGGVYLVTGGSGGLGLLLAEEIVHKTKNAILVLVGRSILKEKTIVRLKELELGGATVIYKQVDVTNKQVVTDLVQGIVKDFGRINGVIHCSGVIRDNIILKKTESELKNVLAPKVLGVFNLDQATRDMSMDFFIIFSSIAGVMGNIGQSDYAAANAFMDNFAGYRNYLLAIGKRSGDTISINWPLWSNGGMQISTQVKNIIQQSTGLIPMRTKTGIELLYESVASGQTQVIAIEGSAKKIKDYLFNRLSDAEIIVEENLSFVEHDYDASFDQEILEEELVNLLKRILSSELKLKVESIDARVPLETYGINSIMIIQLTTQLEKSFGSLPKTLFFEYQSLMELSKYFCGNYQERVKNLLGIKAKTSASSQIKNKQNNVKKQVDNVKKIKSWLLKDREDSPHFSEGIYERESEGMEIAIIGLAGQYPQAANVEEFWNNLKVGRDCITEIPKERWDHSLYYDADKRKLDKTYAKWGGFLECVDCFDPLFFNISPSVAEVLDPQERLFLQCVYHTIEDAGYTRHTLGNNTEFGLDSNVGVFVGVMYEEYQLYGAQAQERGNMLALNGSPASIANRVSYFCGFHGPSMAIDTMCSSSLVSIHLACQSIMNRECEVAIAGGVNLSLHPNKFLMLGQNRFMSSKGRCESFGKGGDGYTPGEGVGAILLKPKAKAIADGDHIYGIIKGVAINHGGKTNGYTVPDPRAQASVIKRALKKAGVNPRDISYIEAHGTGTSLGDPIEIAGLNKVFEENTQDKQFCLIGSAKSNIGHCESAAGIAGVTKVLLQMKHQQIVPSLHSAELNPNIDFINSPFIVEQELKEWKRPVIEYDGKSKEYPRIAGISAFGAGGANAHIIIEEYIPQNLVIPKVEINNDKPIIIVISARIEEQLKQQIEQLNSWISKETLSDEDLRNIAYTLQVGRDAMEERLAFIVTSKEDFEKKLNDCLKERGDFYRGHAKTVNNVLSVFDSDNEMQEVLYKWFQQGKYAKMLELWVKGLSIDWSKFYGNNKFRRISLPNYPFAKEHYWLTDDGQHSEGIVMNHNLTSCIHPLVHKNISSLYEQCFYSNFSGREFFLKDHRLGERKVLPGAAILEMARITGELSTKKRVSVIKDIIWTNQIDVNDECRDVCINLYEKDNSIDFEVSVTEKTTQANTVVGNERIICTEGRLEYEDNVLVEEVAEYIDVAAISARCDSIYNGGECYNYMKANGLINESSFQVIKEVYYNKSEALSFLSLTTDMENSITDYALHPSLLNGAFQTVLGLRKDDEQSEQVLFLPFALSEIRILEPMTKDCIAYVTRGGNRQKSQSSIEKFNITIADTSGKILVVLYDFMLKAFKVKDIVLDDKIEITDLEGKSEIETQYYTTEWYETQSNREFKKVKSNSGGTVLIFDTDEKLFKKVKERLRNERDESKVIMVKPGRCYYKGINDVFEINPLLQEDYQKLLQELRKQGLQPERIIIYRNNSNITGTDDELNIHLQQGIYSLFYLSKSLMEQKSKIKIQLLFAFVNDKEDIIPEYSAISGFCRIIRMENPAFLYKTVEIKGSQTSSDEPNDFSDAELLFDEFNILDTSIEIRYEGGKRFIKGIRELE